MQQLDDQNNQTAVENDQTIIENTSPQPFKFSAGDGLFLGFITTGLAGGVALTLLQLPTALAPSLFFSLAVSSLVHRYLGGIRSADASITTGIGRLGGTLASLVLTTVIFNSVLEKQMKPLALSVDPQEHDLVVLNKETGDALSITIKGKNGLNVDEKTIQVSPQALRYVKQLCRQGEGFCKEPALDAKFIVNPELKQGFARVCMEREELDGYPLVIGKGNVKELSDISKISNVEVYSDLTCTAGDSNPLAVEISQEDARKTNISNDDQGFAFMPGLSNSRPKSIFKSDAEESEETSG